MFFHQLRHDGVHSVSPPPWFSLASRKRSFQSFSRVIALSVFLGTFSLISLFMSAMLGAVRSTPVPCLLGALGPFFH